MRNTSEIPSTGVIRDTFDVFYYFLIYLWVSGRLKQKILWHNIQVTKTIHINTQLAINHHTLDEQRWLSRITPTWGNSGHLLFKSIFCPNSVDFSYINSFCGMSKWNGTICAELPCCPELSQLTVCMKMKTGGNNFGREGDIFKKILKWGSHYKMLLGVKKQNIANGTPPPTIKHQSCTYL